PWPDATRLIGWGIGPPGHGAHPPAPQQEAPPVDLPWRLLLQRVRAGGPNERLGLVQAQHIFGRRGTSRELIQGGLLRVRIPAILMRYGEDGWRHDRFPDLWWMEALRRLGVPFKAVVELWPRYTDEQHAAHATRLVRHARPDVVIIGNELNAIDRPGVDTAAAIERYLNRYEVMHAAIKAMSPTTRVQLYGEAYYGEPVDPEAFLRHVLAALRRRGLPPPDLAGMHVYDRAEVIPARVAGYRRLLGEYGLRIPLSVEELGLRQGVIERRHETRLAGRSAEDGEAYPHRLAELRAHGWLTEAEQAELVAQHLATAAATADQAQIFCAIDFDAERDRRRGLMSGVYDRARPALATFRFMQRLLNDLAEAHLRPATEHDGVTTVTVTRRDGLTAQVCWSAPVGEEPMAPARTLAVPPYTFVCDTRGQLVQPPQARATTLLLPAATTAEAGGAVRILL
ncbi:MAG: hypothetical protein ACRDJN_03770, partial [Chloroflexota bacterium]